MEANLLVVTLPLTISIILSGLIWHLRGEGAITGALFGLIFGPFAVIYGLLAARRDRKALVPAHV